MLDLAEMAKKVEDGEYKTSIEYTEDDRENLVQLSSGKVIISAHSSDSSGMNVESSSASLLLTNGFEQEYDDTSSTEARPSPLEHETKTEEPAFDDKASVCSSIDSDTILAAPQSASAPTSDASGSHGRYSGFHNSEFDDYYTHGDYYSAYATTGGGGDTMSSVLGEGNKASQPFWCCLFPWMSGDRMISIQDQRAPSSAVAPEGTESMVNVSENSNSSISRNSARDDDETSTGSDMFGEKLSEKDRQAVLARLRLAQPDTASNSSPESPEKPMKKGLLNGIHVPIEDTQEPPKTKTNVKSILKRSSKLSRSNLNNASNKQNGDSKRRRSLFPQYSGPSKKTQDLNITFSPMARVLSVKSHKDMDDGEKGSVWWQKSDYEGFRKTGRMITKAMLEGGSEIWLATNRSWQMPNQGRTTTLKHATSLSERQAAKDKDMQAKKEYEAARDKWWHKFGHSRRGLEHIASIDEGRQRQANVRQAIRAVVEENRRHKAFMREDADKLRIVSLQHTTWARDLAMAAGASDADAVKMNFNDESRKSREFYLLKFSRAQQGNLPIPAAPTTSTTSTTTVPAFMRPSRSLTVKPNRLDANTISQIRYRQKKKVAPLPSSSSSVKTPSTTSSSTKKEENMAKKAAGFASGEEVANMSAVLTGMGPLPKSATTAGGP